MLGEHLDHHYDDVNDHDHDDGNGDGNNDNDDIDGNDVGVKGIKSCSVFKCEHLDDDDDNDGDYDDDHGEDVKICRELEYFSQSEE